jgi:hypothetical protein
MRSRVDFCKCRGGTRTNASIEGRIGRVFEHLLANGDAIPLEEFLLRSAGAFLTIFEPVS